MSKKKEDAIPPRLKRRGFQLNLLKTREKDAYQTLAKDGAQSFLTRIERPYRLDTLYRMGLTGYFDEEPNSYWQALAYCWTDSEIDESDAIWAKTLDIKIPNRSSIMTKEDRAVFDALPDTIEVYRGIHADCEDSAYQACISGHSWSLSKDIARKFALRLAVGTGSWIAKATIRKDDVIAYLGQRGEEEIVVPPNAAQTYDIRIEAVQA